MPEEEKVETPETQPEAAPEEVTPEVEPAAEDAAPSEEATPAEGDTVVVDQETLDENPELADAGVEVGQEGTVVSEEEAERLAKINAGIEDPSTIEAGTGIPSDGHPV